MIYPYQEQVQKCKNFQDPEFPGCTLSGTIKKIIQNYKLETRIYCSSCYKKTFTKIYRRSNENSRK